jgi:excisionase family DNA binding protein
MPRKRVLSGPCPDTLPLPFEPLTVRIPVAMQLVGIGRSKFYELIASGDIETIKIGRCTLIPTASLRRLIGQAREGRL